MIAILGTGMFASKRSANAVRFAATIRIALPQLRELTDSPEYPSAKQRLLVNGRVLVTASLIQTTSALTPRRSPHSQSMASAASMTRCTDIRWRQSLRLLTWRSQPSAKARHAIAFSLKQKHISLSLRSLSSPWTVRRCRKVLWPGSPLHRI